ncbi:DUF3144 domain-containing protein [Pseudomonas sp. NFXW11]|uniref:DUF3144 domain-containing protein n=1 Tax=Pseudomonas sp. NFXW11 TaxID=2819531 RepID=UPI003CEBF95E
MANQPDNEFFNRADAVIDLANSQIGECSRGKVSASLMYANARFSAWISATGCRDGEEMAAAKEEALEFFVGQFRTMLEENLDEYIENFARYMTRDPE